MESYDEAQGFLAAYFHTTSYNSNWGCLKIKGFHPIGEDPTVFPMSLPMRTPIC